MKTVLFLIIIVFGLVLSGCVNKTENKPTDQASPTSAVTPASTQVIKSIDQNKINEMENKINSMQNQIDELQTRINRVDLLKPSNNKLIPNVPFNIEVKYAEDQAPTIYSFKENGVVEIKYPGDFDTAHYQLFRDNNTIKIKSSKYDYYGLVLYDNYISAIYDNGWIGWVHEYEIIPPKFNSQTQKYELN